MYIRSFHMDGFGIYSNVTVEPLGPGLTVFLGENEAGKSTCMEFLRTMLTGYPGPRSREAKLIPPLLRGGQAGGSLLLETEERGALRLTRRPGADGGLLTITDADGTPLEQDILRQLLFGVTRDVYRKVFGFSLTELEDLNSLTDEGVRNALYGASFGPGLRSPGEAMALLHKKAEGLFRASGNKPLINAHLRTLTKLRERKLELEKAGAGYDTLALVLAQEREELAQLRQRKSEMEEEQRLLERRLGVWQQWNEWRLTCTRLERLAPKSDAFPEDGRARLAQAHEAYEGCQRQWASQKEKYARLKERYDSIVVDDALLEALPELRRLAERKSAFQQALTSLPADKERLQRAEEDLQRELSRLGPEWTCERIHNTDRSLFAREDLERQAREMDAATSAHQAAVDSLHLCNRDMKNAEHEVASAEAALALLPEPTAELDSEARDSLRQLLTRLEEASRQRPLREHAAQEAKNAFSRTFTPLRLLPPGKMGDTPPDGLLESLLEHQEEALELATSVQTHMQAAEAAAQDVRQAEDQVATMKTRMDELRKAQRMDGMNREELDAQATALRKLHGLSGTLETEQERLAELNARIDSEPPLKRIKNWPLFLASLVACLAGAAVLFTVWRIGPTTLALAEGLQLPIELWSGYLLLFFGVVLAATTPHNRKELRRRKEALEHLCARRDACAQHIAELEEQGAQLRDAAHVESMDPITLEAREALLEHEREQCFQEERTNKDMDAIQEALTQARTELARLQACRTEAESVVQQTRRRWHECMQRLHVNNVPSPEGAAAFFARVEAARVAFGAFTKADMEWRMLEDDIHAMEERLCAMPTVAERLPKDAQTNALMEAARHVLESCREAEAAREQRIKAEAALQNAKNELRRAAMRQGEASEALKQQHDRLESSRAQWQVVLLGLGLGEGLTPETVRQAFTYMENCLTAEAAREQARSRMAQTRTELLALRDPLFALLERLHRQPAADSDGHQDWLASLDTALAAAEEAAKTHARRQNLEQAVADAEDECRMAEAALEKARSAEQALLAVAGVTTTEEFLRQAGLHEEQDALTRRSRDLEDALRLAAGKTAWQDFLAAFADTDQETQERHCAALAAEITALREQEEQRMQRVSELAAQVHALTQSDELPQLLLQEASLVDTMERVAFDWSSLELARSILETAKRAFEQERQPAVIRHASTIFARITGRRWRGISASLEDASLHILPDHGEPVSPDMLSRGTREQAYLALRLAYIANHAAHATPLPIIMDEVLVNFDPQRAERTARAFVELTGSAGDAPHQVLYFTCQPHIVDLLRRAEPHAAVFQVVNGSIRAA